MIYCFVCLLLSTAKIILRKLKIVKDFHSLHTASFYLWSPKGTFYIEYQGVFWLERQNKYYFTTPHVCIATKPQTCNSESAELKLRDWHL